MAFPYLQKLVDDAAAQLDKELLAGLPFTVKTPSPMRLLKLIMDNANELNVSSCYPTLNPRHANNFD